MTNLPSRIGSSYDSVARDYANEYSDELKRKPFDRMLLDEFTESIREVGGQVCDLGCGPGQIARYLKDRDIDVCGIDLSHEMVKQAKRVCPDIGFERGDMLSLDREDNSLAGIVCFYAIIHLERDHVLRGLTEICRVLKPGGRVLISFHGGEGEIHRDEWYEKPVSIDVALFQKDEMAGYLTAAGFDVEKIVDRKPYEFEYPTQRLYAFGTKPTFSRPE